MFPALLHNLQCLGHSNGCIIWRFLRVYEPWNYPAEQSGECAQLLVDRVAKPGAVVPDAAVRPTNLQR